LVKANWVVVWSSADVKVKDRKDYLKYQDPETTGGTPSAYLRLCDIYFQNRLFLFFCTILGVFTIDYNENKEFGVPADECLEIEELMERKLG